MKESELQKTIIDYLTIRGHLVKRNNAGKMFGEHKGKKWAVNIGEAGWNDILGVEKGTGRFIGVEVKIRPNKPTTLQQEKIDQINKLGGLSFVAYSLQDVIDRGL